MIVLVMLIMCVSVLVSALVSVFVLVPVASQW